MAMTDMSLTTATLTDTSLPAAHAALIGSPAVVLYGVSKTKARGSSEKLQLRHR